MTCRLGDDWYQPIKQTWALSESGSSDTYIGHSDTLTPWWPAGAQTLLHLIRTLWVRKICTMKIVGSLVRRGPILRFELSLTVRYGTVHLCWLPGAGSRKGGPESGNKSSWKDSRTPEPERTLINMSKWLIAWLTAYEPWECCPNVSPLPP